MFNEEENDLFQDMKSLPHNSVMSKLNLIGKRAKTAIVRNNCLLFHFDIVEKLCLVYIYYLKNLL